MNDTPAPDINTVREIIEQVAKGLQSIHRQEIVHQDLRPNNIMIDAFGTVNIIDFGAAKVAGISEIVARNEGTVGTAQYTAPEYFLGQAGTTQSDIFSLGVILYQMLSGRLPYGNAISKITNAKSLQRVGYASLRTGRKATSESEIPQWLDFAIEKAVHINPEKRYTEVAEFIHELKQPSTVYLNKTKPPLMQRNPVLFWQSVSLILLCVLIWQSAN